MSDRDESTVHRRGFLQAGAAVRASALALGHAGAHAADDVKLPTRKLGKTGVDVTILNQGTWKAPDSLQRLLRMGYAGGIRYFDTAHSYGSEPGLAQWFKAMPEVRKEIFLVTKEERYNTPKDLIPRLDERLKSLQTDHVDLFFAHAMGDQLPLDESIEFVSGKEFKETAEAIKKSGKAKFIGFSTHHPQRAEILKAAAKAGIADAIMVMNTAWVDKDTEINRALDAVHKAGIGLISMKQISVNPEAFLAQVPQKAPDLIAKGLTPFGALLHAIWSDERFSTCCVSMRNTTQLRENIEAAREFKEPLKTAEIESLRQAFLASKPTLCADCDGRCSLAAGTKAPLGVIARYLTYSELHGARAEARAHFAALPEAMRDWSGADLEAAREACPNGLDFASLLPRVERDLA